MASRLEKGCYGCGSGLHLIDCVRETKQGFASILYIQCRECLTENSVQTSKTHTVEDSRRRVFDINTKVALGKSNCFVSLQPLC